MYTERAESNRNANWMKSWSVYGAFFFSSFFTFFQSSVFVCSKLVWLFGRYVSMYIFLAIIFRSRSRHCAESSLRHTETALDLNNANNLAGTWIHREAKYIQFFLSILFWLRFFSREFTAFLRSRSLSFSITGQTQNLCSLSFSLQ